MNGFVVHEFGGVCVEEFDESDDSRSVSDVHLVQLFSLSFSSVIHASRAAEVVSVRGMEVVCRAQLASKALSEPSTEESSSPLASSLHSVGRFLDLPHELLIAISLQLDRASRLPFRYTCKLFYFVRGTVSNF